MHRQAGFSLLETLIASTLLATALLGLGALAARSLQDAAITRDHFIAGLLLADLEGRVTLSGGAAAWQASGPGTEGERDAWRERVRTQLPFTTVHLCPDMTPEDGDPANDGCDGAGPLTAKLHFRTFLHQDAQRQVQVLSP